MIDEHRENNAHHILGCYFEFVKDIFEQRELALFRYSAGYALNTCNINREIIFLYP